MQQISRSATAMRSGVLILAVFSSGFAMPRDALACACGCGVFDVGANALMPVETESGVSVWLRYSYMNQDRNWQGTASAPAANNQDKEIVTSFYFVGGQWEINSDWTVMAELPVYSRRLTTTDDGTVFGAAGSIYTGHINALGDLETTASYTGFAADRSTGLTFGVKLPTGDFRGPSGPLGGAEFDRDSLPGTGSTDLVFGGYHVGALNAAQTWQYFAQVKYQAAIATQADYRPGNELDAAVGVSYNVGGYGWITSAAPVMQVIGSYRLHDTGGNADPENSGYRRLLLAPGIDLRFNKVRLFADVEVPVFQDTNAASSVAVEGTAGQLTAPVLLKLQVSYDF